MSATSESSTSITATKKRWSTASSAASSAARNIETYSATNKEMVDLASPPGRQWRSWKFLRETVSPLAANAQLSNFLGQKTCQLQVPGLVIRQAALAHTLELAYAAPVTQPFSRTQSTYCTSSYGSQTFSPTTLESEYNIMQIHGGLCCDLCD